MAREEYPDFPRVKIWLDDEHRHGITPVTSFGTNDQVTGLIEWHRDAEDNWCGGFINLRPEEAPTHPLWLVESGNPDTGEGLTLTPSVLCRTCGEHGWIRNGRWESA